ncbi:beta-galactosidase BoGH2A-like [Corticium candelabrum]|uniref:beta-galactosidase BoGH2A-like n=1 Tax=Corticium candelabrum TaxID=121492 RepID=UPI002E252356|nr:beta-galactosidase BoGH2A-like [Corticium candelabrum]
MSWYRKHFNLPSDWKGSSIWIYFEGIFRASMIYLNGQFLLYHQSGYTSFSVRLDNVSNVMYGTGEANENVLTVMCTAAGGTGWWYEGGGIYRHTYLIRTNHVHLFVEGLYGASEVTGEIHDHEPSDATKGQYSDGATFMATAEVTNDALTQSAKNVVVYFALFDENGEEVVEATSASVSVSSNMTEVAKASFKISKAELWSTPRPYLYTLQTSVMAGSTLLDNVSTTVGVRLAKWDPNQGFFLNNVPYKWRGFCDHNDFTGVGVAVPDRVNLFRAQMLRAVGGNSWRMSHNPPIPVLLDILDRLGVVVWDENRNFGNNSVWLMDQRDMVRRDRNHPSVMVWSFCNEGGCMESDGPAPGEVGQMFKTVSKQEDPYRPVGANMNGRLGDSLSPVLDVQGFSHRNGNDFDGFHKDFPKIPTIGSECCSCITNRGEDTSNSSRPSVGNFNGNCNSGQNGVELQREFVAGTLVWTLFDYYGEPCCNGWPMVSSSFGSIDLAGFPKASAFWYKAWFLLNSTNMSSSSHDLTYRAPMLGNPTSPSWLSADSNSGFMIYIVQHWEADVGGSTRTIQAYTNAPLAELFVNGKSQGVKTISWLGWAEWDNVDYVTGNLTAVGMVTAGHVVASYTLETTGNPAAIKLSVDVPSMNTGTGKALVMNGQDAGMVRASIVDSKGRVVNSASHNVTFSISSGPGRIIGVGNGDPICHEPNKVTWRSAFHGLARAIIQVTADHASSAHHRYRMREIDSEGGRHTIILPPDVVSAPMVDIVVKATVEGLESDQVTIPVVSDSDQFGVLQVARGSIVQHK